MIKLALITCLALAPVSAQEIKLPANLEKLAAKASNVVDVTLDANLLQLASRFLSDKDPEDAQVKKVIAGIKGIYVRSFEFANPGEYQASDIDPIRAQLRSAPWARIVGVRSEKNGNNAEIYVKTDGGKIGGLVILTTQPKQLTLVSIDGSIDPEQLNDLGGHFGIPKLDSDSHKNDKGGKDE